MLVEDDVVDAVAEFLRQSGWRITGTAYASQRGDDLIAERDDMTLRVEAKGEGSSKPTTRRFGHAFNRGQVGSHVSVAIYRALTWVSTDPRSRPALAFPDNEDHRRQIAAVSNPLRQVGIGVFWVNADLNVELDAPWDL